MNSEHSSPLEEFEQDASDNDECGNKEYLVRLGMFVKCGQNICIGLRSLGLRWLSGSIPKQSYVQNKIQRGFYVDGKSIFVPAPGPHPSMMISDIILSAK
ncbi:unnamed protein product [Rhizophagus irregularis]|nr:unnamed protein product [Rhizophagus irregularis]